MSPRMQDLRFRHLHGRVQVSIQTASFHSPLDFPKNTPPPTNWTLNISRPHTCHSKIRTGYLLRHGHLANMGTTTPPRRLLSGPPGCHRFWADDMTGCFLISFCLGRLRWHQFWSPRRSHGLTCRTSNSPRRTMLASHFDTSTSLWSMGQQARVSSGHTHTDTLIHPRSSQSQHRAHIFCLFSFPTGPKPAPHPPISQALPFPSFPFSQVTTTTTTTIRAREPPIHPTPLPRAAYATLTSFAAPNLHMSHRNTHPSTRGTRRGLASNLANLGLAPSARAASYLSLLG